MTTPDASTIPDALAAALAWWRAAGVEDGFEDTARSWIAPASAAPEALAAAQSAPAAPAPPPAEPPAIGGPGAQWPMALADFAGWWLREPSLDPGRLRDRVAPRGPAAAALMVIVPEPEREDGERLLSGPRGELLGAMLKAMGHGEDEAYLASALPSFTPGADWEALRDAGLGRLLLHHIGIVAPRRILVFGQALAGLFATDSHRSSLSGHDPAQKPAVLPLIYHENRSVPLLVAHDLSVLRDRPFAKAAFWRQWLAWSEG